MVLTVQGDGEIPSGAFENDTSIKKAVIQNGITYVGANSFNGCSALKSISLADSISEIGENAFANTGLKSTVSSTFSEAQSKIDTAAKSALN